MAPFVVTVAGDGAPASSFPIEAAVRFLLPTCDGHEVVRSGSLAVARSCFRTCPEDRLHEVSRQGVGAASIVIADARLDNRDELIQFLSAYGVTIRSSDTEFLSAAYERWGERCPEFLVGDFAFVVWHATRKVLFGATDPLGARHLRYSWRGATLAVGSRTAAVAALRGPVPDLNEPLLRAFLSGDYARLATETCFSGVLRVPAGHTLHFADSQVTMRRYATVAPSSAPELRNETASIERLRELLERAVRARLRSVGAAAVSLSGGLDSSIVTALVHGAGPRVQSTVYSSVFERTPRADERIHAAAVMARCSSLHWRTLVADDEVQFDFGNDYSGHLFDEPQYGLPAGMLRTRLTEAASRGHRVMLSGHFADQVVVDGYAVGAGLADLPIREWPMQLRHFRRPGGGLRVSLFEVARAWASRGADRAPARCLVRASRNATVGPPSVLMRTDLTTTGDNAGVDLRFPFADRRVVEHVWGLPATLWFRDGFQKFVLRKVAQPLLPESVVWRTQPAVFGDLVRRGLVQNRQAMLELLPDSETVKRGLATKEPLEHLILSDPAPPFRGRVAPLLRWLAVEAFLQQLRFGHLDLRHYASLPTILTE